MAEKINSEWMPLNPCPCGCIRYPDGHKCNREDYDCTNLAEYEGGIKYLKKLLVHQKKIASKYSMPDTYSAGIPIEYIDRMLKQLEKKSERFVIVS